MAVTAVMAVYDLIVRGGVVIDGSGAPRRRADVGVARGRIAAVGAPALKAPAAAAAAEVIDATGLCVAPGFIDIHSHSDVTLLVDGGAESKLGQGVTTEVVGNCGTSPAPLDGAARARAAPGFARWGIDVDWHDVAGYLGRLAGGVAVNVATLVGHGTLRAGVYGYQAGRPGGAAWRRVRQALDEALRQGAFGLSLGLGYAPGCYADVAELSDLAAVVAGAGGFVSVHLRGEGELLLPSLDEALEVAARSGARLQVSHLKAAGRGAACGERLQAAFARLDAARGRGLDVGCDFYPYAAASTTIAALFPPWTHDGGLEALKHRLRDSALWPVIATEMAAGRPDWDSPAAAAGWDGVVVTRAGSNRPDLPGRSLQDLAAGAGVSPAACARDLALAEDGSVGIVLHMMREEDVTEVAAWGGSAVASDAAALSPRGPLGEGRPHPRAYGAFPRALAWLWREAGVWRLEEAVRRMTGLPARVAGLPERGAIRPGAWADLVVFDPAQVADAATYDEPHRLPRGIPWVVVNGRVAVRGGAPTGVRAGHVLRRGAG